MTIVIQPASQANEKSARGRRRANSGGLAAMLWGLPTPKRAREIAIRTGKPVAASNNTYVLPMSAAEEKKLGDEQNLVGTIYNAVKLLANPGVAPDEMIHLGKKHYCHDLEELARHAAKWLSNVLKEYDHETVGVSEIGGGECR